MSNDGEGRTDVVSMETVDLLMDALTECFSVFSGSVWFHDVRYYVEEYLRRSLSAAESSALSQLAAHLYPERINMP